MQTGDFPSKTLTGSSFSTRWDKTQARQQEADTPLGVLLRVFSGSPLALPPAPRSKLQPPGLTRSPLPAQHLFSPGGRLGPLPPVLWPTGASRYPLISFSTVRSPGKLPPTGLEGFVSSSGFPKTFIHTFSKILLWVKLCHSALAGVAQ